MSYAENTIMTHSAMTQTMAEPGAPILAVMRIFRMSAARAPIKELRRTVLS